jgi:hypothetical protein
MPPQVPRQLPVQTQVLELPLVVQLPAVQLNLQSAVPSHAKAHVCPSRHVASHFEPAAHDILQLVGSASQLFTHVLPWPHARLFPDWAVVSSALHAITATEKTIAIVAVQSFIVVLLS